jgi:uncharacterized protein (TIGR00730 family)
MTGAVCVYCGSAGGSDPVYAAGAQAFGTLLARRGVTLVYGGGNVGLMGIVADAALAAGGRVVGVIPELLVAREVAHRGLTELHVVADMHARKRKMADLADGFVALPGGAGTFEELFEVYTWAQLGYHAKPVGLLDINRYWQPLLGLLRHAAREGFMRESYIDMLQCADTPDALLALFAAYEPPVADKWAVRRDAV